MFTQQTWLNEQCQIYLHLIDCPTVKQWSW